MRIALITDIHEDILSLTEAFRKIDKNNIDDVICLGDISGYSVPYYKYLKTRNARECLSLVKSNCKIVVLGNHDIHAARIIPKNCPFFDFPKNWHELDYLTRHKLSNGILWLHEENDLNPLYHEDDINFLHSLPEYDVLDIPGFKILLTHYVYPNISGLKKEFYTYQDEFKQHFEFMKELNCNISFTGHAHTKGFFKVNQKKIKQYGYRGKKVNNEVVCIGIPPVTSNGRRNGFCIFDSEEVSVQAIRI